MSVVEKDLLFDDDVLALGADRVGLLARLAYVAALANKHVTASDGTLPYADSVLRLQLLPDMGASEGERGEVRKRLAQALIVPYEAGGKAFAFVAKWWRFNERPDKAVRGVKNPPVPAEILSRYPVFAEKYRALPDPSSKRNRTRKRAGSGILPEMAGNGGRVPPPDPDPDPEAETAPGSGHDYANHTQSEGEDQGMCTTPSGHDQARGESEGIGQGRPRLPHRDVSAPANWNGHGAKEPGAREANQLAWLSDLPADLRSALHDCKSLRERRACGQPITPEQARRIESICSSKSDPSTRSAVLERLRRHFEHHGNPSGETFLVEECQPPGHPGPRSEAA